MTMKKLTAFILMAVLVLLVACSRASTTEESATDEDRGAVSGRSTQTSTSTAMTVPAPPAPVIIRQAPSASAPPAPEIILEIPSGAFSESGELQDNRMIVRTADMALVVNDVAAALDQIAGLAENIGGYVVSSQRWQDDDRLAGAITIRVPADDFGDVMAALRSLAVDVTHEDTSARDVTEEYVDLTAGLKNLEATEEQYLRLMEKAEDVADILAIQRELSKTRDEIERTKGRIQYLERTSATSLISVQLNEARLDVLFQASKRAVKEREKVEFQADIDGGDPPYSYQWEFGDGEASSGVSPTHAYKNAGSYTVSLKVSDDEGNTDTRIRDDYIIVSPGWSAGGAARDAWNGLVVFGQALADIFIWLGIFSPIWIVGGVLYWRWRRRRKRTQQ